MSNAASIRVPTNRNFHLERDDDGYIHVYARDIQTIRTNLNEMYGVSTAPAPAAQTPTRHRSKTPTHRVMSSEARKRIADAQKKRWATARKENKKTATPKTMAAGG